MIHKICELYKLFHEYLKTFPKQEKYSLGNKIEDVILEILEYTLSASYKPKYNKKDLLIKASDKIDLLKILVRLSYETQSINLNKYIILEIKTTELGKIIGGWIKSN